MKCARVDDDGALGGQQVVERDRQRARVEHAAGLAVGVGLVAPAPRGDLRRQLGRAARRPGARSASAAASASAVAAASPTTPGRPGGGRRSPPRRGRPGRPRARRQQRAVRVVHWFSDAPKATTTSASREQPLRERRREAAGDAEVVGIAGEEAVGHRARGQQRAASARPARAARAGAGEHGAAPGDDRGAPRAASRSASAATAAAAGRGGAGGGAARRPRRARRTLGGLHVERQHEDDGAALDPRAAHRAGDVGHRAGGPVHALGRRPDRPRPGRPGRCGSSSAPPRRACRPRARAAACGSWPPRSGPVIALVRPGPWWTLHDGEAPAHAAVAVGHATAPGLVARRVERAPGVAQGVGHGEVAAAHEPEHGVHALAGDARPTASATSIARAIGVGPRGDDAIRFGAPVSMAAGPRGKTNGMRKLAAAALTILTALTITATAGAATSRRSASTSAWPPSRCASR